MITEKERKLAPIQKKLQKEVARFFQEQKNLFLVSFERLRDQFPDPPKEPVMKESGLPMGVEPSWQEIWDYVSMHSVGLIAGKITDAVRQSMIAAGLVSAGTTDTRISFTLKNPAAVEYIEKYGSAMITRIDNETRKQIQTIIRNATDNGDSYGKTAQTIRSMFDDFSGLKPQLHIKDRATLVAVTETGNAFEEASLIQAKAMEMAGLKMEKHWLTVGDSRVSDGCQENEDAGWIPVDDAFPSGHQRPLRFPGCRCDMQTRMAENQD